MEFRGSKEILLALLALGMITLIPGSYLKPASLETHATRYAEESPSPARHRNRADPANPGPGPDPFPWNIKFANFEPNHCAEIAKAKIAFGDALELALTALKADYRSPAFTRYFQPVDEPRVKAVFTALLQASTMMVGQNVVDMWNHFTIYYGTFFQPVPNPIDECRVDDELVGYLVTDGRVPFLGEREAVCALCPVAFSIPNLRDVSCANLGTAVSITMDVVGSTILHEMLHWNYLIAPFSEGERLVDWEPDPPNWPWPPDGYGPYNAMQINKLSTWPEKPGSVQPNPVRNPDNYAWFALEAFWRKMCPHVDFAEAVPLLPNVQHPQ